MRRPVHGPRRIAAGRLAGRRSRLRRGGRSRAAGGGRAVIRINLLPRRRRRRLIPESGVVVVALLVIGALAASYAWETWRNRRVEAETAAINQKLVVVRRQVAEVLALERSEE